MSKPAISNDIVGMKFDPVPVKWRDNDTMLYALAVGCNPDEHLDFVYEGKGPKVLPTYAVIPGMSRLSVRGGHCSRPLMESSAGIVVHQPIPPASMPPTLLPMLHR